MGDINQRIKGEWRALGFPPPWRVSPPDILRKPVSYKRMSAAYKYSGERKSHQPGFMKRGG